MQDFVVYFSIFSDTFIKLKIIMKKFLKVFKKLKDAEVSSYLDFALRNLMESELLEVKGSLITNSLQNSIVPECIYIPIKIVETVKMEPGNFLSWLIRF